MNVSAFPSGEWVGYYRYSGKSTLFPMHLTLNFVDGSIQGAGVDRPGTFMIEGTYDQAGSRAVWVKRYVGKHSVQYEGAQRQGEITGSWSLVREDESGSLNDDFRIWPLPTDQYSDDEPLQSMLEKEIQRKIQSLPQ